MRQDRCGECGDEFVWDVDAGSAVCPSCGTLQDSSQVVLDAHIEPEDNARERDTFSFYHRTTLKSFRGAHGWNLPGQDSQAAAERNKIATRDFITALSRRIGHPSLAGRTLFLFELAMQRGCFRSGRKERLVAGASLAIALRENQKGETVKDIAYLLDDSPVALARVVRTIVSLLDAKLVSVDPSWHLPTLQKYLADLLTGTPPSLPSNLVTILKSVHIVSALRTAASLSDLASRAGIAVNLPSQATACAIYILALEAEALSPLPQCGELAKALGGRFKISKEVVLRRYRLIYDYVQGWTSVVPWMNELKTTTGTRTTPKVAKRVSIARCLKDAVQYQESLWRAKLATTGPLVTHDDYAETVSSSEIGLGSEINLKRNDEASILSRPRKRRKKTTADDVSRFLLSPLHAGPSEKPYIDRVASLEGASHVLISNTLSLNQRPTRLQLLTATKTADEITDEELFEAGELDSFLRTAEEREAVIQTFDWAREKDRDDEADSEEAHVRRTEKSKRERDSASRTNVEGLACLLDEKSLIDWAQNEDKDGDHDDNWLLSGSARQIMTQAEEFDDEKSETSIEAEDESQQVASAGSDDDGEVLGPWRPLSSGDE